MEFPNDLMRKEFADEIKEDAFGNIICETDGSLCRDKGLEVIFSLYKSKELLLNHLNTVQLMAKRYGAISWDLYRKRGRYAGFHINRNRTGWKHIELMRLVYLTERYKQELVTIAGRECNDYAPYSHNILRGARTRLASLANGYQGKYAALNLSSGSRIEWRLFSGTLSIKRANAYFEIVEFFEFLAKSRCPVHSLKSKETDEIVKAIINNLK